MQDVICMKWGTRYGPEYVNRLYSMIQRNSNRKTRLTCFTDDRTGVREEVRCLDLPPIELPERIRWLPWQKLSLWQEPLGDLTGDLLFLDLDVVVTGGIDDFFDYEPGRFCVIRNWTQPNDNIGNTSVFRFRVGQHNHIYDNVMNDQERVLSSYRIEQVYISREISDMVFWPDEWCLSFKHSLIPFWPLNFFKEPPLPPDARVICFTGKPDPEDAVIGEWPEKKAWKKLYKHVVATKWIGEHWR